MEVIMFSLFRISPLRAALPLILCLMTAGVQPLCAGGGAGDVHALLIGVGKYKHSTFHPLYGPPQDVRLMEKVLKEQFRLKNIEVLVGPKATRKGILDGLEGLVKRTRPGDTVFIYFSGHGTRLKDKNGDEKDRYDEALVAHDFNYKQGIVSGVVLDDEWGAFMDRLGDRRVIAVMDCCHSGTTARSIPRKQYRFRYIPPKEVKNYRPDFFPAVNPGLYDKRLPPGHIYFGAAQDSQKAAETYDHEDGKPHGIFTRHLAEGLRGNADTDYDGTLTYRELYHYTRRSVCLEKPDQIPSLSVRDEGLLDQPFLGRETGASSYSSPTDTIGTVRVKLEGLKKKNVSYRSAGFKMAFTPGEDWDFLVKKQDKAYALYGRSGEFLFGPAGMGETFRRLDALVLVRAFKLLRHKKQSFNITADAGQVGGYFFRAGDYVSYNIRTGADAYLLWLNIDPGGHITVLLPNFEPGGKQNLLKKGIAHTVPGEGFDIGFQFQVGEPFGKEWLKFIAFKAPFGIRSLCGECRDGSVYFFSIPPAGAAKGAKAHGACSSWVFYKKLQRLLSARKDWSETMTEIETRKPATGRSY